ncbi:acyl dehydrogenase [Fusarium sp. NRRL 25303]|nr:acyl dehydrogenase [Fusarium sp. NRRL 25303]
MSRLASRCLIHLRPSPPHPAQRHAFSTTPPRHLMSLTGFSDSQQTSHDQDEQDPKEFHAALAGAGWLGIALTESLGGSGLGISDATMMIQRIAESGAGMAVTKPSEGLSLFCIDLNCDQPGLEMRRIKKMGGRAVDANSVFLDNYTIPSSSLIGSKNKRFKIILYGMNAEYCLLAGEALGLD